MCIQTPVFVATVPIAMYTATRFTVKADNEYRYYDSLATIMYLLTCAIT